MHQPASFLDGKARAATSGASGGEHLQQQKVFEISGNPPAAISFVRLKFVASNRKNVSAGLSFRPVQAGFRAAQRRKWFPLGYELGVWSPARSDRQPRPDAATIFRPAPDWSRAGSLQTSPGFGQ
jgi:hypothetical protein